MAFQAVGSFTDPYGRTVYYDSNGTHSLLPMEFAQQQSDADQYLANLAVSLSPVEMTGQSGAVNTPVGFENPYAQALAEPTWSPEQLSTIKSTWEDPGMSYADKIGGMEQYGVDVDAISQATGVAPQVIGNTLLDNGAERGFGGYSPGPSDLSYGTYQTPEQLQQSQTQATNEFNSGVVVGGGTTLPGGEYSYDGKTAAQAPVITNFLRGQTPDLNRQERTFTPQSLMNIGGQSSTPDPFTGRYQSSLIQALRNGTPAGKEMPGMSLFAPGSK